MRISIWQLVPVLLLLASAVFSQLPPHISWGDVEGLTALQNYQTGRNLEAQGLMSEAHMHYNEAIRISQDEIARNAATADTYTVMTWAMRRQNRHAEVLSWGEQGLRLFPNEHRLIETMGQSLFFMGDHNRSLSYMQRYVNFVPVGGRSSIAYFFIGEIYRIRQQFHNADIAYTTAVNLQPGLPLWWFRLGSVREAVGDFAHAIEAYERAITLNPNHQGANEGLARSRMQVQTN